MLSQCALPVYDDYSRTRKTSTKSTSDCVCKATAGMSYWISADVIILYDIVVSSCQYLSQILCFLFCTKCGTDRLLMYPSLRVLEYEMPVPDFSGLELQRTITPYGSYKVSCAAITCSLCEACMWVFWWKFHACKLTDLAAHNQCCSLGFLDEPSDNGLETSRNQMMSSAALGPITCGNHQPCYMV